VVKLKIIQKEKKEDFKSKFLPSGCSLVNEPVLRFDACEATLSIRKLSDKPLCVIVSVIICELLVRCCRILTPVVDNDESFGNVSYVSRKNKVIS